MVGVVFVIGVVFVVGVVFDVVFVVAAVVAFVSCTKIICKKVWHFETFHGKTDLYAEDENHANQFNHSINRHPSNIECYSSVVPYECIINVFVYICMMVFCSAIEFDQHTVKPRVFPYQCQSKYHCPLLHAC